MSFIKNILTKYRDLIIYGVVGVLTTLLGIILYWAFTRVFHIEYLISTALSFVLATVFAFFGNKYFAFKSKTKGFSAFIKEFFSFFSMRIVTMLFDLGFMFLTVDIFKFNDFYMKIASNIIVIIVNYIFSKLVVFKKQPDTNPH